MIFFRNVWFFAFNEFACALVYIIATFLFKLGKQRTEKLFFISVTQRCTWCHCSESVALFLVLAQHSLVFREGLNSSN